MLASLVMSGLLLAPPALAATLTGPSGSASRARRPLDRRHVGRRGSATRARWRAKPPRPNPFRRTRRLVRKSLCRLNMTVRANCRLPTCCSAATPLIVPLRLKRQPVAKPTPMLAAPEPRLADAEFADSPRLVAVAPGSRWSTRRLLPAVASGFGWPGLAAAFGCFALGLPSASARYWRSSSAPAGDC